MRIKADWTTYLHNLKRREMDIIFGRCPKRLFGKVLELGAGDGCTGAILAKYTDQLICTDINPERLTKANQYNITFKICDAEEVGDIFKDKEFDMVFSSSLLEHLPDCERALRGIHKILADDGISIHFMPNRYWKLATIVMYIPNKIAVSIDKILAGRIFKRRAGHKWFRPYKQCYGGNNIKVGRRRQFFLSRLFLPRVHGASKNTIAELIAFGKKQWIKKFESAGFRVLRVKGVIFNSGYGFGFDRVRKLMEHCGLSTLYAYTVCKSDGQSEYAAHFTDQ